jgi:hypothetical protein
MSMRTLWPIRRFAALAVLLGSANAWAQFAVGAPRPEPILPPATGNVQSVPIGPQNIVFGPGNDGHLIQHTNHPPIETVPPMPMSQPQPSLGRATDSIILHDGTNDQTWEVPTLPASGAVGATGQGYTGSDGFVVPPEMARNFGSMNNACCLTSFPASANCRLLMRFVDGNGTSWFYVCSGAMQDAGMVMCAAHCVYFRGCPTDANGNCIGANINNWAAEIWVYPGWDGNGSSQPGGQEVIQNFGWTHSTFFGAGTDYVNNGNFDADFGIVMAGHGGERHVGMLTGWYGWAWGFDCGTIQSRSYFNYSFPSENSGCCPAGHNGRTMQFWGGTWDACPGNQLQLFTTCGCNTAVWGGMSGSNAYYIDNGSRLAHAVCSTSNRSTRGQYCKMWEGWSNFMEGQRTNTRGGTFDLEGFRYRLTGSTTIQASTNASAAQFLASNISNADPGNANFTYRVYLSNNDLISSADTLLGTFNYSFDYAPMQNVNVNVPAVTIPNVPAGTYWLGAVLDAGSDAFFGNNDTSLWDAQQITVTGAPPGAPPNNLCANATAYAIGTSANGSTSNATSDGASNCPGNNAPDVWYTFTAPSCGVVHFDTCGSFYDTVISLHTGCPGTAGNQIACNDDNANGGNNACGGGLQSGFDVGLNANTSYKLRVSGFSGASGNFSLNSFYVNPGNDDCPTAAAYTAGTTINGCMGGASNDGSATCGASGTSGDVWFRLVAPQSGLLRINTCGSAFDTVLSVHTGCPGTTANQIACNDDSALGPCTGTLQSDVDVGVVSGTTYYIRLAGFAGSIGSGLYSLSSAFIPPPNNTCAGAINYSIGTSLSGVTAGGGAPDGSSTCGSTGTAPDVWYRIVGTCGGLLNINTCGSSYDTVLSVHTACPGTTANQVACNDDGFVTGCGIRDSNITFTATSGATYYVRVSGFSGLSGVFRLNSQYVTAGSDDCDLAPTVGDGSYVVGNCGATTDGPQEHGCSFCCSDYQVNNDLWFRYVAGQCGTVTVTTCGNPGFDTKLAAYNGGCPFGDDTAIACNDDAGCTPLGTLSRMSFSVTRGGTYTIRFGGFSTARGTATMQISTAGACGSADFNCDGDVGTDSDIESFFNCLAGNCPPPPCCASADFNGDGDVGTDADIEAFFRVLAGGNC